MSTKPAPSRARPVRRALALLLLAAGPLTACGIPATGVIEAGAPASGVRGLVSPAPSATRAPDTATAAVPLYFVQDGALTAVARALAVPAEPASAVALLFQGPDRAERAQGLESELPRGGAVPALRIDGVTVTVGLPARAGTLSDTAVAQLACTAAAARLHQDPELGTVLVTVEQPDGRLAGRSSDDCPGLARTADTAAPTSAPPR
ncbi:hypothetical protein AB0G32_36590 [Streptomyces sp. NPDC023723]|uniref:hypothetical protein n=1 Tax=Streptomyces sp. NPDC023723 TaxID=3154323 RepID=UPI0033C5AA33